MPSVATAIPIGGVEFPDGAVSFADAVVLYEPAFGGGTVPSAANSDPSNSLGVPEVPGNTSIGACSGVPANCPFVSLGSGGRITLQFTDNLLTGSGDSALDLWIFEVGPDIEDTFVEISMDGSSWFDIGKVFGTTGGIDIDAFGFDSSDTFGFVRLRDDPNEGATGGPSVGADIDAVGAISTIRTAPEPATLALLALGAAAIGFRRRRF
jgi:hypothetical protein